MKTFSFNRHSHVSLTHACILAAREQGFSVSISGHGIQENLKSEGGFLHFQERRESGKYDIFQNGKNIGYHAIDDYANVTYGRYGAGMDLDDFITKFSQMSAEDVVKEFVTESVAKLQGGETHVGSTIYDRALVAELWKYVQQGY